MAQRLKVGLTTRANASGGSAAAGGMNLHARVAAVAAVYLLGQRPLGWLKELEHDTPTEIWFETNGPGDDLRLVLSSGLVVEAQVKKGLGRGDDLWTALGALAQGIHQQSIAYGVLLVDADASNTVRSSLARGIVRLGNGRTDSLDEITSDFKRRLESAVLPVQATCEKIRIVVMHCADHDDASEAVAKSELARLCATESEVVTAWQALQISAHNLIELRGRWTVESLTGVLKASSLTLSSTPGGTPPFSPSGWAWESLNDVSPHRGFIQSFRQHYLSTQAFGGRDAECKRLDTWLFDSDAPSRMLISGPTARGKSALLVHWTEHLESDATWSVIFVPISLRFGTDRPAVFYALLAMQLASVLKRKLELPTLDLESYYQGIVIDLLRQATKQSQHVLVVVDGLDEAQGNGFSSTVFPPLLPPNIKVLVSAREQAGDRGSVDWLKRLDWHGRTKAASEHLLILDRQAVVPIVESVGLAKESLTEALIDQLMVLSLGEPLLLGLYAEDLSAIVKSGLRIGAEVLDGLSPGFAAYFSNAFDAQQMALEHGDQEVVDHTLAVLAMALGPIEGTHLTDLVCSLCHLHRPAASDRFVRPLKRYIAGDGSADHGYVLNHPKLGEYLREVRFDSTTQNTVHQALLDWGRGVAKGLAKDPNAPAPVYVMRNYVNHLRQSESISLDDIELLLSKGWMEAWHRLDKDFVGYADSLLAASEMMRPCADYQDDASQALRLKLRIALSTGSVKSQGASIPSELLAMALQEKLITLHQALNVAKLQTSDNQPGYLVAIAAFLPPADIERALSEVQQMANAENRVNYLARLALHLGEEQRNEVIGSVLSCIHDAGDSMQRIIAIASLAPAIDGARLESLLTDALTMTFSEEEAPSAVIVLSPSIGILFEKQKDALAERLIAQCLHWIRIAADPVFAVEALSALATQVTKGRLETQIARLAPVVKACQTHSTPIGGLESFEAHMERVRQTKALVILESFAIHSLPTETYKTKLHAALTPLLNPGFWEVNSLLDVAPLIRADSQQEVAALCHHLALKLSTSNNRVHALMKLAKFTNDPHLRKSIIGQALTDARRIEDDYSRCSTLLSLFSTLPKTEKEHAITELLSEIGNINYLLHSGKLLLDLAKHTTGTTVDLVDMGFQAIQRTSISGFRINTLLEELPKLPHEKRKALFQQCWQQILSQKDMFYQFQLGMAARYAGEYWTVKELEVVRSELTEMRSDLRVITLIDLLPVASRLGTHDLVDETFVQIATQENLSIRLSYLVQAIKFLPQEDTRRSLVRQYFNLALNSDNPGIGSLISGFELLDANDQTVAWPKLIACAKISPQSADFYTRLSAMSKNSIERVELLEAALSACEAQKVDQRIPTAANIALTCRNQSERLRAFDLMTATPAVIRNTVLVAMSAAASAIAEVGSTTLTLSLMQDIRENAKWWP